MTLFEFITVSVSIVLSLGVVRLLDGAGPVLGAERRYWVHAGWVLVKLQQHFGAWWVMWSFRGETEWNYLRFLAQLVPPILLYLQATTLVTQTPRAVDSWRDHYYSTRRAFFGLNLALASYSAFMLTVTLPGMALSALAIGASVVGLVSTAHRVHVGILIAILVAQFGGLLAFGFTPSDLTRG